MLQARDTRRFRRDERGSAAIEFALVAPLLFFALLSLVEIGVLGMVTTSLDNAVVDVSRRVRTGQDGAAGNAEQFKTQICEEMGSSSACPGRLAISVQTFSRFFDANQVTSTPPDGQFDAGGPGDIVLVKVNYRWPLMTPFLTAAFDRTGPFEVVLPARAAFKNEPYQ